LSYRTVKVVNINDRRLGVLYYFLAFCILTYLLGYTLLYEKRYLLYDEAEGSVRFSLQRPPQPLPIKQLPYCSPSQALADIITIPCEYWDENLVVYPSTEASAMFVSTRITQTYLELNCSNFQDPSCTYIPQSNQTFYIADIEHFTLMLDHAIVGLELGIQKNGRDIGGDLYNSTGQIMNLTGVNHVGVIGQYDILEISALLEAAGITSLDQPWTTNETMRYAGVILLVLISYSNTFSFSTSNLRYSINVKVVNNTEFKSLQTIYTSFPKNINQFNRHGIRILILQSGSLGKFDFQTLLVNLISSLGLFALITLVVDIIATYCLPQRSIYYKYKFDETIDFSDLRDKLIDPETDPLLSPKFQPEYIARNKM